MKKHLLLLSAIILTFTSFSQKGVYTYDYTFEAPYVSEGKIYLDSCQEFQEINHPAVPQKPVLLLLPYGTKADSIVVVAGASALLSGTYDIDSILPGSYAEDSTSLFRFVPEKYIDSILPNIYSIDNYYPSAVLDTTFRTGFKRGHSLLSTMMYPVQYNPVTKKIQYYKTLQIKVYCSDTAISTMYKTDNFTKKQLKILIDNPDELTNYPAGTGYDSNDYEYLIFTTNEFKDSLAELVDFNGNRGMRTKIATMTEVSAAGLGGIDEQDSLRNYIIDEYKKHQFHFMLIVGDVEFVKSRKFSSEVIDFGIGYWKRQDMLADMYFGYLDGNWQKKGSMYYSEYGSEDLFSEVHIGRFSVENQQELSNIINKTLIYEGSPNGNVEMKSLLVGDYLWPSINPEYGDSIFGSHHLEENRGFGSYNRYFTQGFTSNWNIGTLYEIEKDWDYKDVLSRLNYSNASWVVHSGHGEDNNLMWLTRVHVGRDSLKNKNFYLLYSWACSTGEFGDNNPDAIAEKMVNDDKGPVVFIGNSYLGTGTDDGTNSASHRYSRYFHDAIFGKGIHNVSAMLDYAKDINAHQMLEGNIYRPPYYGQMNWSSYVLNVLGDPALHIWSETPKTLSAVQLPTEFQDSGMISVPPYAWVNVLDNSGDILFAGIADENGDLMIKGNDFATYIAGGNGTKITFKVKADNYIAYTEDYYVGIGEEKAFEATVKVLPNPANDKINVLFSLPLKEEISLELYDLSGRIVEDAKIEVGFKKKTIDTSKLPEGFYLLQLKGKNRVTTQKVIISR